MAVISAESSSVILQQALIPFLLAGLGMVIAGMVLDEVQVGAEGVLFIVFV